jgi:hypothetical protein
MKTKIFVLYLLISMAAPAVISLAEDKGGGAAEMARKLQDPLANIAAVMTESDILFGTGDDDTSYSFQLQPIYAIDFPEKGFSFIPRAVIPILGAT